MGLLAVHPPARLPARAARALLWALAALGAPAVAQAQPANLEAAVKASYLAKFAPFVDWPAAASATPDGGLTICVIGADPFGDLLDRAVAGQRVGGRPITIDRLAVAAHDSPCRIAFVGGSPAQPVADALHVLQGAPVLTVTDDADAPGIIDFAIVRHRVRFRIDDEAAAENGLTISSKLLSLALTVKPRKPSGSVP